MSRSAGFCLFVTAMIALPVMATAAPDGTAGKNIILATTTSTQDSGLLDKLIPLFEKQTGYRVKTIAVGSGQAMAMGRRGEADVLFVHSPEDEKRFMAERCGSSRRLVMHNDFIVAGPAGDPAGISGTKRAADAFSKIARTGSLFLSRGDNSGTHAREKKLWEEAGITQEGNKWYSQTGLGMGGTLNVAAEKKGYTLSDRGTYLALQKTLGMRIVMEGDPALINFYHVIEVGRERWPKVNAAGAKALADFLVSRDAQKFIGRFGVDKFGFPLFVPDAGKKPGPTGR